MKIPTRNKAKTHIRERTGDEHQPDETASTSTQPVEVQDKSTQTQSPADQQKALQTNVEGQHAHAEADRHQVAGQHATGSFTGAKREQKRSHAKSDRAAS
jgi:hypothetical protein